MASDWPAPAWDSVRQGELGRGQRRAVPVWDSVRQGEMCGGRGEVVPVWDSLHQASWDVASGVLSQSGTWSTRARWAVVSGRPVPVWDSVRQGAPRDGACSGSVPASLMRLAAHEVRRASATSPIRLEIALFDTVGGWGIYTLRREQKNGPEGPSSLGVLLQRKILPDHLCVVC